ncbi:type I restriction-modification system subunit M [Thermomonospora umbrina]|uniref:site-specific DNA-methyltransferase (adenine-specific) n=1 Tax=Thermomonospora umbrina TaxID=111806 RepID=A0A3D9SNG8_9ACTN|nr:class I SAM-dependent DNA methyltransferase [Thermomonospora umbrina]REE95980.1 type I restriction enzyme M protein [Thermomonospora umbrina]
MSADQNLSAFIWSVADLLRGDYKQSEYGKVVLPFTVLRRFDCVLDPTRQAVWDCAKSFGDKKAPPALLKVKAGLPFYNLSQQTFETIAAGSADVRKNLTDFVNGFSDEVIEIFDRYKFHDQIERLDEAGLLYGVVARFADPRLDLSPQRVTNDDMGRLFEELIRKFSELSNETAGEHFTPREVINLMVDLLLGPDEEALTGEAPVIDILDPACGTGGMLAAADDHIRHYNGQARVNLAGQELNAESWAICKSDMLMKGYDESRSSIAFGNSFSRDGHRDKTFRYMLANPPFGVEWKKVQTFIEDEYKDLGHAGRFGAGLPRINDGSLLFLQHMMSKMRPVTADALDDRLPGSRIAIVFNGSPLFTGGAGSGESEIRRWIIENDYLEAIVALPDQLFYNTGISTYFWIITNNKAPRNRGKVILLDARDQWTKTRKTFGEKRKEVSKDQRDHICRVYRDAFEIAEDEDHPDRARVKIFDNEHFGYQRITIDRPLRQRFEVTEETLALLTESSAFQKYDLRDELLTGLKPLIGTVEMSRTKIREKLVVAWIEGGVTFPPNNVEKAVLTAFAIADPEGELQVVKGKPAHDPDLRDAENVPLTEDIDEYLKREVLPHVEDAWIAEVKDPKTKETLRARIGYEIPFTRYFYTYTPPRPLAEIDAELRSLEGEIQALLGKIADA